MSKELEAIQKVSEQVDKFQELLKGKIDKAELDEYKIAIEEIKATIAKLEEATAGGRATSEEIEAVEEELEKQMKAVNDKLEKFGVQVAEFKRELEVGRNGGTPKDSRSSIISREELEKFIKATFDEDGEKTSNKASFRIKAAEIFSIPNFFQGADGTVRDAVTGRFVDPTLYQRKRKKNLILDHFNIETINVPKLFYLVKEEVAGNDQSQEDVGGAEWITSGGQKPMRSFRVTTGEVEAKKVAIFGTVEDKLLRDVASLETWVREDFFDEMREAYNDALLNNNPNINPNAPLGLKHKAVQYVGSSAFSNSIKDANEIDAIVAAAADMANNKEQAATVFVAMDVYYKIQILKDNDARYQNNPLVYVNNLGELYIAGVHVVGVDNEDVPTTHLLMISNEVGFKIKNYSDMVFERGLNGEDFRYDRTSYRGYQEVLSYIPTHRENSVMYDTFANIIADITAGS